jgi:hypothetical protein
MKIRISVLALLFTSIVCFAQQKPTAQQLLNDRSLWGKDFIALRPELHDLKVLGSKIEVHRNVVIGSRQYTDAQESHDAASNINETVFAATARPDAHELWAGDYKSEVHGYGPTTQAGSTKTAKESKDQGHHVSIVARSDKPAEFLAPDLTAEALTRKIGVPERLDHEIIRGKNDGRPEVITTYTYAGGAIKFKVSNLSPRLPGSGEQLVQAAVVDTTKLR